MSERNLLSRDHLVWKVKRIVDWLTDSDELRIIFEFHGVHRNLPAIFRPKMFERDEGILARVVMRHLDFSPIWRITWWKNQSQRYYTKTSGDVGGGKETKETIHFIIYIYTYDTVETFPGKLVAIILIFQQQNFHF